MFRQLLRAGAGLGAQHIVATGVTFLVGVLLTRQLGVTGYGTYAFAMSLASLASMVSEFGLPMLALRDFGAASANRAWGNVKGLTRWADRVILGVSVTLVTGVLVAYAIASRTGNETTGLQTLAMAALLVPVVGIARFRGLALLALGFPVRGQFPVLIARPTVFAILLALFWYYGAPLTPPMAMLLQVAGAVCALVMVVVFFRRAQPTEFRTAVPRYDTKGWLSACIPFGVTEGLRSIKGHLGILILGVLATAPEVGFYRVAQATTNLTMIATSVVTVLVSPNMSRLYAEGDHRQLQKLAGWSALAIFGATALASLPLLLLGDSILQRVFGSEFGMSTTSMQILLVGNLVASIGGPARSLANMTGHERLTTMSAIVGVGGQVAFSVLLIPFYGAEGAALSVAVSGVIANFFAARMLYLRASIDSSLFASVRFR